MKSEFHKHTTRTTRPDGSCMIECKRGFWAVDAPSKTQATAEAVRYFLQYWEGGEYADNPMEAARIALSSRVGL